MLVKQERERIFKINSQFICFYFIIVIFIALTEKLLADTELQLEILEENVKDKNLDKLMNDYAKKMQLLQDEKYAEFQQLKSIYRLPKRKRNMFRNIYLMLNLFCRPSRSGT